MDRITIKDFFKPYFEDEFSIQHFGEWAWGPGFEAIRGSKLPERWNKLHGDKLFIEVTETIADSAKKMVELYRLSFNKNESVI